MHHRDRSIGIACVDNDGRRFLQVGSVVKPLGDGVACSRKIVVLVAFVVVRQQVVVEKDRIKGFFFQYLFGIIDIVRDGKVVAFKAALEPPMTPIVIVEQKNSDRRAFGS